MGDLTFHSDTPDCYSTDLSNLLSTFDVIQQIAAPTHVHGQIGGHGGRVVTLSPPTSEAGVQFPALSQVGELVVACCWSSVYSTEP